jgi:hypothetical protein
MPAVRCSCEIDASGISVLAKPFDIDDLLALVAAAAGTLPR